MTDFYVVRGNVQDYIEPEISGVQDLTIVSGVVARVWRTNVPRVTLDGSVLSASARILRIQMGTWLRDLPVDGIGKYKIEFDVTFDDGTLLTWPAPVPDTLHVRDRSE